MKITKFAITIFAIFFAGVVLAQQAQNNAPVRYTEIKYSADKSSYRWEDEDRILALVGNVKFSQGDTVLLADKVDYRESLNTAVATGNLRIYDDQHSITATECEVNFQEKKATLIGNVRLVAKPKEGESRFQSLQDEWKDDAIITCDAIEYFYQEKRGVIPSTVKIVQDSRTVTADSAVYLGRDEIIHLDGNVKGEDAKDKHTFAAPKVIISLKEGDEWVEAEQATGTFYIRDDDEESPESE